MRARPVARKARRAQHLRCFLICRSITCTLRAPSYDFKSWGFASNGGSDNVRQVDNLPAAHSTLTHAHFRRGAEFRRNSRRASPIKFDWDVFKFLDLRHMCPCYGPLFPAAARASRARKKKGTITWAQRHIVCDPVSGVKHA